MGVRVGSTAGIAGAAMSFVVAAILSTTSVAAVTTVNVTAPLPAHPIELFPGDQVAVTVPPFTPGPGFDGDLFPRGLPTNPPPYSSDSGILQVQSTSVDAAGASHTVFVAEQVGTAFIYLSGPSFFFCSPATTTTTSTTTSSSATSSTSSSTSTSASTSTSTSATSTATALCPPGYDGGAVAATLQRASVIVLSTADLQPPDAGARSGAVPLALALVGAGTAITAAALISRRWRLPRQPEKTPDRGA